MPHLVLLLLFAHLALQADAFTLSGTWLDVNDTFTPRDKFGLACVASSAGSNLTVFAGREASSTYLADVFTYNTVTQQWVQHYPVTTIDGVAAMAFGRIGNVLWAFGGQILADPGVSDLVRAFDLDTNEWKTPVTTGSLPSARRRPASWVYEDTLVVFGGLSGAEASASVYSLNTTTLTWTLLAVDMSGFNAGPTPRFDASCVLTTATAVLCFGGTTGDGDSDETWMFDHTSNAWQRVNATGSNPSPRRLAMSAMLGNELLVWAGWDSALGAFVPDTTLHILNLATGVWRGVTQPATMETRDSGGMCAVGSDVFLLGGARDSGRSNELFKLNGGTFEFELVSEGGPRPPPRAFHSGVRVDLSVYIMFGFDGSTRRSDVWQFDTQARAWQEVATAGGAPTARSDSCAATRGSLVFVYGGASDTGSLSDLWALNVDGNSGTWTQQSTQGTGPGARSEHVCFFITPELFVVGLGRVDGARTDTWYAYDVATQSWSQIFARNNGPTPSARSSAFAATMNETHAMVGGGIGTSTYSDRWTMSDVRLNNGSFEATWSQLPSTLPSGASTRDYIRGEAAVTVSGHRALICGGALSSSFPAPDGNICYSYDANSGVNARFVGAPYAVSGASAVHVGSTTYMFGGQLGSATVKRNVYVRTMAAVTLDSICPFGTADDSSCVHCGSGTLNPACEPAPKGVYANAPYASTVQCAAGEFQPRLAASAPTACTKCPTGTYNPSNGSASCTVCPSTSTCPLGSAMISSALSERPFIEGIWQPERLSPLQAPWLILVIVGCSLLVLFVGTMVALRVTKNISVNSLDMFSDSHRTGFVGTQLRVVKTTYGGVAFSVAIIGMMVITAALVTAHFYDNLDESKSSVPRQVVQSRFPTAEIDVSAEIALTASVAGVARTVNGVSSFRDHCITNGTSCVGHVETVTAPTQQWTTTCAFDEEFGVCTMSAVCSACSVGVSQSSVVRFSFSAGISATYVDYTVASTTGIHHPSVSNLGWVTTIGDTNEASIAQARLRVDSGVLSGFPATTIPVSLQPTYFVAPSTVLHSQDSFDSRFRSTGYHVDLHTAPTMGNVVTYSLFGQYFGVPIDFTFTAESTALFVERTLRNSEVELISQLLGALTGIAAAAIIAMQLMDKHWFKSAVRSCCGEKWCRCLWLDLDDYADEEIERAKQNHRYHPKFDDDVHTKDLERRLAELQEVEAYRLRLAQDATAPFEGNPLASPHSTVEIASVNGSAMYA